MKDSENINVKAMEVLIEQMQIIAKHECSNMKCDKSFLSIILGKGKNGKYKILRNGQTYEVKNVTGFDDFKEGQQVWVKIPCGCLEDMHIYGRK